MSAPVDTICVASSQVRPLLLMPRTVGFYLAARLCITYLFFQSDPQTGAYVSAALNLSLLLIVAFYSFGPGAKILASAWSVPCIRWVFAFLFVSFCSLLWSATVSVPVASVYWAGMAADVGMILLLFRSGTLEGTSSAVIAGYVSGCCFIACVMWLSPTMQDLRPGNDDFFSPNAIGFSCAFGAFLAQYLGRSAGGWNQVAIFLSISLLRSLSKTTILAFAVAEGFILFRDSSISRRRKAMIAVGAIGVFALFWPLIANYYEVYINAGNQAETLTGRVGIWAFVLERSLEQPWIGHGFHSFRNVIPPFGTFEAWHAHNEILQQFYTYGVVGLMLLAGLYGTFYLQARRLSSSPDSSLFAGLLIFIFIRGLGDTDRFDLSLPLWAITLFGLMLPLRREGRQAQPG